ncbi:NAD(P)H-dependent dehydrogenase/reductase [candidate division KSB1 bacterium]|nr:nitroreductase family protein [candidate division KSB1 bacterium]RQW00626.1 MAG: NAD(P)H-dependent dehydrogenase/reductase [candidate division KSB1 bacterium]
MIDLLRRRRSIRTYIDQSIEPEKIQTLKEAILRSPSSRNINPWEFIFVQDKYVVEQLSYAKQHGSAFLIGAPLAIVVLGDSTKSDVWVEDCSIASIIVQLVAQSLGLGSCWVQIRQRQHNEHITAEEFVQHLLDIPEHIKVESIIGIGHPAEKRQGVPYEKLQFGKIHLNKFGDKR